MKNLLLFLGLLFISSCEITERVYIEENGDVSYATHVDLSQLMKMMPQEQKSEDLPIDTIYTVDELAKTDSELKQSMGKGLEDEEERELMKDFSFHVKLDETTGFMNMFLEKKSLKEFNGFMNTFAKKLTQINQKRQEENKSLPDSLQKPDIEIPIFSMPKLSYNGKTFERKGEFRELPKESTSQTMDAQGLDDLIQFNLEYHFPKRVKSVSDENAKLSADGKTVYLSKPMKLVMKDPNAYDFEVKF